ncbi:MAG: RNA-binding S4 domain-containing protein [Boseongicola sp. SB0676_bin_33]|nr:RNA-binding S4 domain-containing protein [Boseongicola sp. SB0676_bin_33]
MSDSQRLDQWIWHARFFKTRGMATRFVAGGYVRVDSQRVSKPSFALRPGHVLTFRKARRIRVIRVDSLATRRGPAPEAQALYTDLAPSGSDDVPRAPRFEGKGRPSGKDRRNARLYGDPSLD